MSATASTGGGSVTITLDGSNKTTSMKLMEGTVGPAVFDIRKL
jgi:citrate synthase